MHHSQSRQQQSFAASVLECHFVVVDVIARRVIRIVKGITMLGGAGLKRVLLIHIKGSKLVKIVYWTDLELCPNISDQGVILQTNENIGEGGLLDKSQTVPQR